MNSKPRPDTRPEDDAAARLPTEYGEFTIRAFGGDHVALMAGDISGQRDLLVRLHSECLTGDVFGSRRCDCGEQLHAALRRIAAEGTGAVLYLRQEGRGIGIVNKLRAYQLQDDGADTVQANELLGFAADLRDYSEAAAFLRELGVESVRLLTNNPAKVEGLEHNGIHVSERIAHEVTPNADNRRYLETKRDEMRHLLLGAGDDLRRAG